MRRVIKLRDVWEEHHGVFLLTNDYSYCIFDV